MCPCLTRRLQSRCHLGPRSHLKAQFESGLLPSSLRWLLAGLSSLRTVGWRVSALSQSLQEAAVSTFLHRPPQLSHQSKSMRGAEETANKTGVAAFCILILEETPQEYQEVGSLQVLSEVICCTAFASQFSLFFPKNIKLIYEIIIAFKPLLEI